MLWYYLRITMSFAFPVFYRRLQMKNSSRVREKGPLFLAMNHPNAFMDPLTFSWVLFHPRTRYMARGDAFKKGFAAWALQSMGIVPIFRARDGGFEKIKKNLDSFEVAYNLLDKNQKIMVFAEGLCIQERRLRPIQKGTAKMSFTYLEKGKHDNLKIIPVGIHYSTPSKIRGDVFFHAGEPIVVKDFYEDYKKQPGQAIVKLTALIQEKLNELVPSLTHKENDVLIEQLQPILKQQFIDEHKLDFDDLEHQQEYWKYIIAKLNELTEGEPEKINDLRKITNEYTLQLEKLKLQDDVIYESIKNKNTLGFLSTLKLIVGFPFYVIGKILNGLPYFLGKKIADKLVKGVEFHASIHFGTSALLAKLFFTLELVALWLLFHNFQVLLAYALIKISCGIVMVAYSPFKNKMLAAFKLSSIKRSDSSLFTSLINKRAKILAFFGDFH